MTENPGLEKQKLFKLGKKKPIFDERTLMLSKYIQTNLPQFPDFISFGDKVGNWGMMLNDSIGDCTCAAAGHLILQWTSCSGKSVLLSDNDILHAYEKISGYNPKNPSSDQGASELDVLKYWHRRGIGKDKIGAFASLDIKNINHVMCATYLFIGIYIGLGLPITAQNQNIWDVTKEGLVGDGTPGSWGGHAVMVTGYDNLGVDVVTWGNVKKMTWAFWNAYCEEAYAIISKDFLEGTKTIEGFDFTTLSADLKAISN